MVLPAAIIVAIVIAIIATILLIVSLSIIIATGRNQTDPTQNTSLVAAGALYGFTVPAIIVAVIIAGLFVRQRLNGKSGAGLRVTFIIISILAAVFIITGAIITFIVANQLESLNSDEARNLRGAAAVGIVGFVLYAIAFVIIIIFVSRLVPAKFRKVTSRAIFSNDSMSEIV